MVDRETTDQIVAFHGHMCPGLALGIRAAEVALAEIGPSSGDEEVVAIVETDMCGVDAIQYLTGCTFGKGNLVHRDFGKIAFTFVRRSDGRAVRISAVPGAWGSPEGELEVLFPKVRAGTTSTEEQKRFLTLMRTRSEGIMSTPIEHLYDVRDVRETVPPKARVLTSVACRSCSEPTMETRIRRLDGRDLCPPCFDHAVAGTTPVRLR